MREIKNNFSFDIKEILESEQLIDCSIAFNGEILILTQFNSIDRYEERGVALFPKVKSEDNNNYRIHIISVNRKRSIDIYNENMNYHFIRDLGDGTILLACARSYYYNEDKYDLNAHVFDCKGNKLREFLIGDGVQDIKVTTDRVIWVSYFDEGIFGNYGWDNPIGAEGLRAWDIFGNSVYYYESHSYEYSISDCYALNISENNIWFYFYTEFYIARLSKGKNIQYWESPIEGAQTLLIKDNYLLLDNGYNNKNGFKLLNIEENKLKCIDNIVFLDCKGEELERVYYFYGSEALFMKESKLYIVNIEKIIEEGNAV